MRVLIQCPNCKRQSDAGNLPVGGRFRCVCGAVLQVPEVRAKNAAVVRCVSCGGPRTAGEASCGFCGADFTVHERDLDTICPSCMTRISSSARFCHNCGTRIAVEGKSGAPTEHPCPACGDKSRLDSRTLGQPPVAILECRTCGGLWVACEAFNILADRVKEQMAAAPRPPGEVAPVAQSHAFTQRGPLYRYCPICKQMMARRNYAKWSGVIVDVCHVHGLWFDEGELSDLLRWVRQGGLREAADRERQENERAARRLEKAQQPSRIDQMAGHAGMVGMADRGGSSILLDFLQALIKRR